MCTKKVVTALLAFILFSSASFGSLQQVKTGWLSDEAGSSGKQLGAEVIAAKSELDLRVIDIAIPGLARYNTDQVTVQIQVQEDKRPLLLRIRNAQILTDGDGQDYGIRIKLKQVKGFEFRLYLHQSPEVQQ